MSAHAPLTLREGRLGVSDPGLATKFHRAVELACSRKGGQKIFIERQHGDYRLAIDSLERLQGELAVVRLHDLKARLKQKLDAACKAYSLSAAECLLAEALMTGLSPGDHAQRRGIRMPTVRSQLSSLYAKVGAPGHAQLVIALWAAAEG